MSDCPGHARKNHRDQNPPPHRRPDTTTRAVPQPPHVFCTPCASLCMTCTHRWRPAAWKVRAGRAAGAHMGRGQRAQCLEGPVCAAYAIGMQLLPKYARTCAPNRAIRAAMCMQQSTRDMALQRLNNGSTPNSIHDRISISLLVCTRKPTKVLWTESPHKTAGMNSNSGGDDVGDDRRRRRRRMEGRRRLGGKRKTEGESSQHNLK
ncbi:hypothetical protein F511_12245 [Dorcoceras hygrometricum]|uniref:Uncharacterized protein n=1 Tax=Dorcoceras hygrometricum TaxID=472368 RepID=A0A2Z7ABM5_9LAMI|nr:hypothetical protein F511_12245 [Dorcoceras hygrometricum]